MVLDAVVVGRWRYYRTPRPTLPPLAHRIFNYTNTKVTQADIWHYWNGWGLSVYYTTIVEDPLSAETDAIRHGRATPRLAKPQIIEQLTEYGMDGFDPEHIVTFRVIRWYC